MQFDIVWPLVRLLFIVPPLLAIFSVHSCHCTKRSYKYISLEAQPLN